MKRFLGLLVCVFALNSCNDGNLTVDTISFENATVQSCSTNNIIYKLNAKEALLLDIPKTSFPSEPTTTNITIGGTNQVVYRLYNGTVVSANICDIIPPITPNGIDQWTASSGNIQIVTTAVKLTDITNNSTQITGYNHTITFKNITFLKGDGTSQFYETFPFGDYVQTITKLPLQFNKVLDKCITNNLIYENNSTESLTLDIDPVLIVSTITPLNTPRIGLISTTNKLTYRLYANGILTPGYFCTIPIPATPTISEEWNAVAGVSGQSGIIEVTTTTNGTGFKHTIVFKKVTLKKGKNDFLLGDNYLYGDLLTN